MLNGSSGVVGIEYLLGTINVSFSNYALPSVTTTASLGAAPDTGSSLNKKYNYLQDGVATGNLQGTNALIAYGANSTSLLYTGSQGITSMNFVFTSSTTGANNSAALSATLGITGPTTLLGGTSTSLTGSVTNSGVSPADPLNWGSTVPGVVSLTPSAGSGLAGGASTPLTGTLTANTIGFGPWTNTVAFTGTDATTSAVLPTVTSSLSFTLIGKGTVPSADKTGTPGGPYGNLLTTQGAVTNLAGLTTTLGTGATSFGIGNTTATILAGTTSASTISEQWRSRSAVESFNSGTGFPQLISDVVNLNGVSGGSASTYVLQMTYDASQMAGGTAGVNTGISEGFLFLGSRNATTGDWQNAIVGNDSTGSNAGTSIIQSSFASYTAAHPTFSLASMLGTWGVDTTNNDVWAVVDHDAEFAVVPEPGTIGLLIGGIAALGFAYRRRKAAKA